MSLRARFMWLVLLATLLPALFLSWRFVRESEAEIGTAVESLAHAADSIAADLEQRVQGTAQLNYGLAHSRVLDNADRAVCSAYLSDVREAYPQYTGIITVLPDGQLHCDSLRSGRTLDLTDRSYFKRAKAGAASPVLEPTFGRLTGNSVLQIVYPARSADGSLRFLLVASLNLQAFAQRSPVTALRPGSELLLVDQKGVVMAASGRAADLPKPGGSIAGSAVFGFAQAHPEGGTGELTGAGGLAQVWAVAAVPATRSTGLHVLMGLPKQVLVADARQRLRQDLLVLAAAALLLFAGVWLLAEWGIRRQVSLITTMVRDLGSGNLNARIAPPFPRGELGGLMAVLNSTAASLQQQRDAIRELGARLQQAQKLEAIGTMAGGIAHDFNNILAAILGNLSLAQGEVAAGQAPLGSLEQIRRAALRARELVQRIRIFSRRDAPAHARLALLPVVEEVLALVRVTLPASVTLKTELAAPPGPVWGDATQLHQVLMNLCTNALQALQGQPGTVSVGLETVELGAGDASHRPAGLAAGPHARLWVSDTGRGIDAAHLERIFEPYFTTKGGGGGTGLGLSVVHGIVNAHHGGIVVQSVPGQGSTFSVYLPLLDAAADEPGPAIDAGAAPAPVSGTGQHVLYLDDDDVMCAMVERLLARAGYRVSCHVDADAALAALHADPQAYDLVLTDFNMPGLSGLDVSRSIAGIRPDLPVIMISGYVADELPMDARRVGVREVVGKQNVLEDLLPAIGRALAG